MKGYRFYEVYASKKAKRKRESQGECLALCVDEEWYFTFNGQRNVAVKGAVSAVYDGPDSPVGYGAVGREFLRERCRRVSEKRAREIHPRLVEYLREEVY